MKSALTVCIVFAGCLFAACADRSEPRQPEVQRPAGGDSVAGVRPSAPAPVGAQPAPGRRAGLAPKASRPRRVTVGDVDFTGIGYDRGDAGAPVELIDLSDFACPYCGEFSRETYPAIEREYVRTGKVYFKYVPFIAGSFPHAREATRAAECAAEQGRFWEMLDRIYATQAEWRRGNVVELQMAALAGTIPVDSARFAACYRDGRTDQRTARATAVANELGVRMTPSFLVDGRPVQGALPLAEFRKVIEAALLVRQARR